MGKKMKGFKLGRRLIRVTRWVFRRFRIRTGFRRLGSPSPATAANIPKRLLRWGRQLATRARYLCSGSGYMRVGSDPVEKPVVPKGHLAVYVGQKDSGFRRELLPVIYFNHPLFSELLREAEEEFGFEHPGGIMIPCRVTEFERVKTHIAAGSGRRRMGRRI